METMETKQQDVLISGGGIAGLALAIFLKRAGISVKIYEGYPYYVDAGASVELLPAGVRVLKALGLEEPITKNSIVQYKVTVRNCKNEEKARYTMPHGNAFGEQPIYINRSYLIKALLEALHSEGLVVQYGKRLKTFTDETEGVIVQFEDGTSTRGKILIGADGIHSATRKTLYPEYQLRYSGLWSLVGITASEQIRNPEILLQDSATIYQSDEFNMFISKSHPSDRLNLSWQAGCFQKRKKPAKEFENRKSEEIIKDLKIYLQEWDTPALDVLSSAELVFPRQVYHIDPLPYWSRGRVALIGDALHTTSLLLGYGTSFALEDAMYLAKMLKEHDYPDAFYYYEYDRRERVETIKSWDLESGDLTSNLLVPDSYSITWEEEEIT
jgi:2-polyprenyl-6-methoxyphenol hydroxylase-like FAD-dependent oxidoreductase